MRLETITFITVAGGTQTLEITNYREQKKLTTWAEPDEAIDGSLRQNLRGTRWTLELDYEDCLDGAQFRSIMNNIATDFNNGLQYVEVGIDLDNVRKVTFDSGLSALMQYFNQHGLFVPTVRFIAINDEEPTPLSVTDYRFVNEAVTVSDDYGLITEAVTTSEDYALII